jgi:hypothetical protein
MKKMAKIMAIITLFGLLLMGCGNAKETTASAEADKPKLEVKADVMGTTATIHIMTNLVVSKEHNGLARKAGEGHLHVFLDDGEKKIINEDKVDFPDLSKGKHNVKVSLHNNDHTPYEVAKTVEFEVK